MDKYRILSLDGGGIKGVVTVVLLERLSREPGLAGWLEQVDLIAGTSTGGLIALALASGLSLEEIRDLYVDRGRAIFADSWLDDVRDLGKLIGADYGTRGLRDELQTRLGNRRLSELSKKVLITAFDLDNEAPDPSARTWKPKLFHNFAGTDSDGDQLASDVGLYTAAAPTYFPSVDGFVDGGVYATNPSTCALAQALDRRNEDPADLSQIVLLSLGTGTSLTHIARQNADWGLLQWAKPLIDIMLDGTKGIADYQCRQILGERYERLAPVFPSGRKVEMDAVKDIPFMLSFAADYDILETARWLSEFWV